MNNQPFQKFINPKNNAAIKEKHKQDKRKAKKQRALDIEKHFAEKRAAKQRNFEAEHTAKKPNSRQKYPPKQKDSAAGLPIKGSTPENSASAEEMPLNKYLAHCGVASRREAATLIAEGRVKVNKEIIKEPGFKVTGKDEIYFDGRRMQVTKHFVYILLNKPKDYITTTNDPQDRKTVLQLTKTATDMRIYPVGRLDRNTSGVLLLTNDGDLTQQLTHPSFNVKKVYEVKLDKALTKADFEKIVSGLILEDGEIFADALGYPDPKDRSVVGIELHSGRNRIVRRIFEHLGYDVRGLDRVLYANLTKKNVQRGNWRYLTDKEVSQLKQLNSKKKLKKKLNQASATPAGKKKSK